MRHWSWWVEWGTKQLRCAASQTNSLFLSSPAVRDWKEDEFDLSFASPALLCLHSIATFANWIEDGGRGKRRNEIKSTQSFIQKNDCWLISLFIPLINWIGKESNPSNEWKRIHLIGFALFSSSLLPFSLCFRFIPASSIKKS